MKHEEFKTKFIATESSRCTKCLKCADVCPAGVFGMKRFLWMKYFHIGSPESCIGCMKCVKACEFDAVKVENFCAKIDATKCTGCGKCAEGCPVGAIDLITLA